MRRSVAVSLLGVVLLLCRAHCSYAQDSQRQLLEQASEDANHGRYSSAKAAMEAAIAMDANQAEPWYQLGLLDGQIADYRGAEQAFRHSLTLDPHSAKAHCRLGQTLVAQPEVKEDWKAAVAEFRMALQLDPAYPESESLLGLGLMHLGDRAGAIATLRHVLLLHPAQASAHLNLALALEAQPDGQEEAAGEYRAALAAKPDAPETEASLGKLLLRLGRPAEAEQALRRALRLDPDLQDAHFGLARVLKVNKKTNEAAIELGLAAEIGQRRPDSAQAIRLNNDALQLAANGDLPNAIAGLRKAVLLKPDYGIAKYNLGLLLADSGDLADAKEQLIDAASLLPGQAAVWFDLGRVLAKLGEVHSALETVFWATRLAPANSRYAEEWTRLRAVNPSSNSSKTIFAEQSKALGVALPGPPRFGAVADTVADRVAFARELRGRGDLPGAAGELMRALELKPNAVDARIELADIYTSQSRWELACAEYRKALLVAGEQDVSVRLALGNALLKGGKATDAAEQFGKALELEPTSRVARAGLAEARQVSVRP